MNKKGIYCLVFKNPGIHLAVGALGVLDFSPGWHIYVGSALGNAGLLRVRRHIKLSTERSRVPRWHIDYLLLSPDFHLESVYCGYTEDRLECTLANLLGGECVKGFGCSDCRCISHLFIRYKNPHDEIISAFGTQNIPVHIKKIK